MTTRRMSPLYVVGRLLTLGIELLLLATVVVAVAAVCLIYLNQAVS